MKGITETIVNKFLSCDLIRISSFLHVYTLVKMNNVLVTYTRGSHIYILYMTLELLSILISHTRQIYKITFQAGTSTAFIKNINYRTLLGVSQA